MAFKPVVGEIYHSEEYTMSVITTLELKERLAELQGETVTLHGWIRNHRKQKNMGFIDFFDGACFKNPQVVYDNNIEGFEDIRPCAWAAPSP